MIRKRFHILPRFPRVAEPFMTPGGCGVSMVLTLVLAEAELEIVPEEARSHPSVRASARRRNTRPSRTLLDASEHHDALDEVAEGERRGRPELVHVPLLMALDSVLNKREELRVLVHTRNDELVRVAPETRIMRNYPRFVGLMEQLFRRGKVPPRRDDPLMVVEEGWSLERVLQEGSTGPVVAFSPEGEPVAPGPLLEGLGEEDATVVVGAFPSGGFHADLAGIADRVVSLGPAPLMVWTVVSEVLVHREAALGLLPMEGDGA